MSTNTASINKAISLIDLGFQLPNGQYLFKNITTHIQPGVSAFVGCNGVGKSLLMQLIAGKLNATEGQIVSRGKIHYVSQSIMQWENCTVGDLLGVTAGLAAIARISNGSIATEDYELAEFFWDWKIQVQQAAQLVGCEDLPAMEQKLKDCSGGEQMRLMWLQALRQSPDWLILDEPSNHLDAKGRAFLYQWLSQTKANVIVVSHDRELLQQVSTIYELSSKGLFIHGGNYQVFKQAQQDRINSQQQQLTKQRKQLRDLKTTVQMEQEKQQKKSSSGKQQAHNKGRSVLEVSMAKEKASQNQQRINKQFQQEQMQAQKSVVDSQQAVEWCDPIEFELKESQVSDNQLILSCVDVEIGYTDALTQPINLQIVGAERVHIKGDNGSGKSTFLKTLLGKLPTLSGELISQVKMAYLDQHLECLIFELTALENFQQLNAGMSEQDCRQRLAWLGLRGSAADLPVKIMSGGEKLKTALACCLLGETPVKLLLLDEPGNHLDLAALQALEKALQKFKGAMIIVSHDEHLLNNLKPQRVFILRGNR